MVSNKEPYDYKHWVGEERRLGGSNIWFYIAIGFWGIGIAAAVFGLWPLAATGIITGTIAGVRSR